MHTLFWTAYFIWISTLYSVLVHTSQWVFSVVWMPIPISSSNSTSKWSLMIGQCEKYGYNFFSPMSFWENANLVFWPCQNSWFWGWKIFFSIAIFHKNHFAYYVLEPFLHQKALKQSICLILAFCATVAQNLWQKMTNTLFESFLVKKWSWLIVTKHFQKWL